MKKESRSVKLMKFSVLDLCPANLLFFLERHFLKVHSRHAQHMIAHCEQ